MYLIVYLIGIFCGILEITIGFNKISILDNTSYIQKIGTTSLILGFGGFSVHMQVASIIADARLSMKPYLFGKLLQGIFASLYSFILIKYTHFFNWDVIESFNYANTPIKIIPEGLNLIGTISMILAIGIITRIVLKLKKFFN